MSKIILIILLNLFMAMTAGGSVYAQKPPQNIQDSAGEKTAVRPEAPKQSTSIAVNNGRLSVDLVDASLGETIRSISQKAGFRIEGNSSALGKKITTKFSDLDVDIGIARLFSLVKESNYLINYDTKGSISVLKLYETGPAGIASPSSSPAGDTGATPFKTWRSRRLRNSQKPVATPPPAPPAPEVSQPETPVAQPTAPEQEEREPTE